MADNKWWCGYKEEKDVIVEDFDPMDKHMGRFFKVWIDRYAFRAQFKGGGKVIRPDRLCVTSNWSLEEAFYGNNQILGPLMRRFHVVEFTDTVDSSIMPQPLTVQRTIGQRDPVTDIILNENIRRLQNNYGSPESDRESSDEDVEPRSVSASQDSWFANIMADMSQGY